MCRVPYHSAEAYIARLIAKRVQGGHLQADRGPRPGQRAGGPGGDPVVTPAPSSRRTCWRGEEQLPGRPLRHPAGAGLCFGDISTGEVVLTFFPAEGWAQPGGDELAGLPPGGPPLPEAADPALVDYGKNKLGCRIEQAGRRPSPWTGPGAGPPAVHPGGWTRCPQGAGLPSRRQGPCWTTSTPPQKTDLSYLTPLRYYATGQFLELDPGGLGHLELAETIRGKEKKEAPSSGCWRLDGPAPHRPLWPSPAGLEAVGYSGQRRRAGGVSRSSGRSRIWSGWIPASSTAPPGPGTWWPLAAGLERLLQNHLPGRCFLPPGQGPGA